jgi:hypothetical protein
MKGRKISPLAATRAGIAVGTTLVATLGAGFFGSTALAAPPPTNGTITVNGIVPLVGKSGPFMLTGAINDAGTSPVSSGATSVVILSKGTITVNSKNANPAFNVDPNTCAVSGTSSSPVQIVKGTGAYQGITGSLTTTFTVHGIARKVKGSCSQNVPPIGGYVEISATGPITIP